MPATVNDATQTIGLAADPKELAQMQSIIDAVSAELGLAATDTARREAIADRVITAYRRGGRLPLNMVSAGLAEHAGCQA